MSVTTRTGDTGFSSTGNGRFRKDAPVFDVLGDLDELVSALGALPPRPLFAEIQRAVMALSADVAGYAPFRSGIVPVLESEIARLEKPGPFRLTPPRGPLHPVRALCRRAERRLVAFRADHPGVPFLNRLSDCLYVLAESENQSTVNNQ